jgi:FtsZ-binding cell division protein ZapB
MPDIIDKGVYASIFKHSIKSRTTEKSYLLRLKAFARYVGVDDLEDLLTFYNGDPKALKLKIINYLIELDKKLVYGSRSNILNTIKHFYDMAEVILPWKVIYTCLGKKTAITKDREPTHEEIAKLLKSANLKYKAIILFLSSTASRSGAIYDTSTDRFLTIGDFEEVEYEGQKTFRVHIYNESDDESSESESEYYAFCTPEAHDAIIEYWDSRRTAGEKLIPQSAAFRGRLGWKRRGSAKREEARIERVNHPKPLTRDGVEQAIDDIWRRSGLKKPLRRLESGRVRYEVQGVHGFRKFGISQMSIAGVEVEKQKIMTGHSIGVRKAYAKYPKQVLLEAYFEAVPYLTIDQSKYKVEQLEDENVQLQDEMTKQNNTLEYKYEQLENRNKELEEKMQAMMSKMDELIKSEKK